ncbi:LamG-like jellyroll fold domain-containing protein [Tuwongella immobilis]|uniref:PA14 domain-containing protein n=1 Tax=Tuwongella immobilis TaxID=692036 RepID=A0A6C2YIS4_9BACT|nr:LamG-like jellyroll fold domain-containing protein [Tuwongella immobilis]VIP00985.1 nhl repeat containing protein : Uncharacterized protein OS=Blastopirellula marina DSM 3645 GN=DSM3645_28987 PE=4 SV=1: FlgD_ig: PA14: Laminin_G_3 [Tuwongella immobilis]VTR97393.1 nhl repeat containing protein : Uncharacterized protein OS=Blastopirellula marina DSM 3645 GN=DSM3645_28987 PE=4 SV=1: FlgD_ig: PA14: Laminin_G_3 [Tuwongella immobilis]
MMRRWITPRSRWLGIGGIGLSILLVFTFGIPHRGIAENAPQSPTSPPDSLEIRYAVAQAGRASLAVYDASGRQVRTLLTGKPHAAGEHRIAWDGLDRYGVPVAPGEYTWKLVASAGLRAEFITQVGQTVNPVWEKATGNHEPPASIATDATGIYRVGATNEGAHWAVKIDWNGRHLWTNDRWAADPWVQSTVAVALVKDRLFELLPNGHVYGYSCATGRVFTGGDFDPKPWVLRWNSDAPAADASDEAKRAHAAARAPHDLAGDASQDLLVAAYPQHDSIVWYSAKTGEKIAVAGGLPQLAGITCDTAGTVYAISAGAVVRLTRDAPKPQPVIAADRLQFPWRLTIHPESGDFLIAENRTAADRPAGNDRKAAPHHRVQRFSKTGKHLQSLGNPAGRQDGIYRPEDFRNLTDIDAAPGGGFLITEGRHTPPRRSAEFTADGQFKREWISAQHYGVIAAPEPNRPEYVWTLANAPNSGLIRWHVDFAQKQAKVVEIYQDVFADNPYAIVPPVPQLLEHRGRLYIQGGGLQPTGLSLCIYDPIAKRVRPCNASESRENKSKQYLWNDLNDDGKASDDEITWLKRTKLGGWIHADDLSLQTTPTPTDYQAGHLLKPTRITANGTPIYDVAAATVSPPWNERGQAFHPFDFRRGSDGSLYGCFADSLRNPVETHENHGAWYYNSCSGIDRLVKWNAQGQPLWSVGRHSPDADHDTGSTAMPRGLVGLTHGCIIWADASDEETCRPTVWTEDGLYVDELLRIPLGNLPKSLYGQDNANEYACGHIATDAKTGEVIYSAVNSAGGSPLYRITGWNGWQRESGRIRVTKPAARFAKRNGTGLTAEYFNTPDCTGKPALTRVDPLVYFNWANRFPDPAINQETYSVRWSGSYEATTNEPTRFEIRGSFPWRDRGEPLWSRLWLGDSLVFDSRNPATSGRATGTVTVMLHAGQTIGIRLECGFRKGQAAIALSHDTPTLDRRAILPEHLHPVAPSVATRVPLATVTRPETLAHFDWESPDGTLLWSKTGGDRFGRATGQSRIVPGRFGHALELTAQGEFSPAAFSIDEELQFPDRNTTVAFWFRTTAARTALSEVKRFSSYNNRWSDHRLQIEGGIVQFQLTDAETLASPMRVNDGDWHHLAAVIGPKGHSLFVDGKQVAQGKCTVRQRDSNRLGMEFGPGSSEAVVAFDEVQIFSRPLDESEILKLAARK